MQVTVTLIDLTPIEQEALADLLREWNETRRTQPYETIEEILAEQAMATIRERVSHFRNKQIEQQRGTIEKILQLPDAERQAVLEDIDNRAESNRKREQK